MTARKLFARCCFSSRARNSWILEDMSINEEVQEKKFICLVREASVKGSAEKAEGQSAFWHMMPA